MKTRHSLPLFTSLLAVFACVACAPPKFQAVSKIPDGRGLVYVYAPPGAVIQGTSISHNGDKIAGLGPQQYFVHFPEPGTNSYGFRVGYFDRGGLVGMMLTQHDPSATRLRIDAGRTYYLRLIGGGMNSSLWRVEETTAKIEITNCHPVEIEKAKRVQVSSR